MSSLAPSLVLLVTCILCVPLAYLGIKAAYTLALIFHELGHACIARIFSRHTVRVYVGSPSSPSRQLMFRNISIQFSRVHMHRAYCQYSAEGLSLFQKCAIIAAGPVTSISLAYFAYLLLSPSIIVNCVLLCFLSGNLLVLLFSLLPLEPKRPSTQPIDSIRILQLLKESGKNFLPHNNTLLLLAILFLSGGCADNPHDKWTYFTEERFGFTVEFPREFTKDNVKIDPIRTKNGIILQHIYGQSHLAFYYSVSCAKFPPALVAENLPEDAVKKAIDDVVNNYQADVLSEQPVQINGIEGRKLKAKLSREKLGLANNNTLHTMVFLKNNILYRITAVGIGNESHVKRFLDSFELKPF